MRISDWSSDVCSSDLVIFDNLVPQVGAAVLDNLQGFAANAGRLTGFGIVGLIVTAVLLLSTIEGAFNNIWRVVGSRSLLVRLLSFWAILTLTPVLTVASLRSEEHTSELQSLMRISYAVF